MAPKHAWVIRVGKKYQGHRQHRYRWPDGGRGNRHPLVGFDQARMFTTELAAVRANVYPKGVAVRCRVELDEES